MEAGEALAAALGGTLTVGGEAIEVDLEGPLADLAARLAAMDLERSAEPPADLDAVLRPYQQRGLAWLTEMADLGVGGVLADDMGLGKTIQMLALHLARRSHGRPTLVVCPASVLANWERETARFAPGVPTRRFHGPGRDLDGLAPDEIVVATYGVVRRDVEALAGVGWGLVVADEAQAVKNPNARTARALRRIRGDARFALTGTPVENRLTELWAILDWTTPGLLGPLDAFRTDVALPIERYQDEEVAETLRRVVRPFLLRRKKSDPTIAPDLPAEDRDRPDHAADRRAGDPLPGGHRRGPGPDRVRRGDGPPGPRPEAAHRPQADLQPPGAVPAPGRAPRRPVGQARRRHRVAGDRHRRGRGRPRLHPVRRHGAPARVPPHRAGAAHVLPPRLALHRGPRGPGRPLPGGRGRCLRDLAAGGRHGDQPDPGHPRRALRPLVEPRGRGPGQRPGVAHRPDPPGRGPPPDLRGHGRGPDRHPAGDQARPGRCRRRCGRGLDLRAGRRGAGRAGAAVGGSGPDGAPAGSSAPPGGGRRGSTRSSVGPASTRTGCRGAGPMPATTGCRRSS